MSQRYEREQRWRASSIYSRAPVKVMVVMDAMDTAAVVLIRSDLTGDEIGAGDMSSDTTSVAAEAAAAADAAAMFGPQYWSCSTNRRCTDTS